MPIKSSLDNSFNDSLCVLAIDPALSTTGYAVISINGEKIIYANKFCTQPKYSDDDRIDAIVSMLFSVASQYKVSAIALEDGFLGKNAKTAMQLSQLRGAIIEIFKFHKYSVSHMLPTEIRHELGIGGNASKEQVAQYITNIYKYSDKFTLIGPYSDKQGKNKTSDIYDSISIGVAYARFCKREGGKVNAE